MTENIYVTIILSLAPTIAAIGALIVGLRNSKKADQIHILVNSNLSAVKADLALALERVAKLELLLTKMAR